MVKAYYECYQQLKDAGVTPILQYIDNEVSEELITTVKFKKLQYQLASPHDHWLNPAEWAIQTLKNHFIANLQGCEKRCPKYLWYQFIPQTVMTLNMLGQSRINPKLWPIIWNFQFQLHATGPAWDKIYHPWKNETKSIMGPPWEQGVVYRTSIDTLKELLMKMEANVNSYQPSTACQKCPRTTPL